MANTPNIEEGWLLPALNPREFRFVEEYCGGSGRVIGSATRAARAAGFPEETALQASQWLKHPDEGGNNPSIYFAVQRRRKEIEERIAMDKNEVLLEISKLARVNAAMYTKITSGGEPYIDLSEMTLDELAAIGEVKIDEYTEGRGDDARDVKRVTVKPWDKKGALELLTKVYGMQKTVHSNDPNNPMPGVNVNVGPTYDWSKLTLDEASQLQELLKKCAVDAR